MRSKISKHAVRDQVRDILKLEEKLSERAALADPLDDHDTPLTHLMAVVRIIDRLLKETPPELVALNGLEELSSGLGAVVRHLNGYLLAEDINELENASNALDHHVVPKLWAFVLPHDATAAAVDAVGALRSAAQNAVKSHQAAVAGLTKRVDTLQGLLTQAEAKVEELTDAVDLQRREAVAVTAEVRGEYAKTDEELRKQFSTELDRWSSEASIARRDTSFKTEELLTGLEAHEANARRIVNVVGNIGVTGNYQKIAADEAKAANFWRWATVFFFGTGVVIALASLIAHVVQEVRGEATSDSFWTFAMRFVTAIAIALPAFYTARESARHRTNADRARQKELELASLGPFIEFLSDDKKSEIREKLVERYFGNGVEAHEIKPPVEAADAAKLVSAMTELVSKVRG